jgi:hypothetical protein
MVVRRHLDRTSYKLRISDTATDLIDVPSPFPISGSKFLGHLL